MNDLKGFKLIFPDKDSYSGISLFKTFKIKNMANAMIKQIMAATESSF